MNTPDDKLIGGLIRTIRIEAGINQTELGRRMGITQGAVSKMETGELGISLPTLRDFCQAVGVTMEDFVRRLEVQFGGRTDAR